MNPIPWFLRVYGGWNSIKSQVNAYAKSQGIPTYDEQPTLYRFEGWGLTWVGRPAVKCNVKYRPGEPIFMHDLGAIVA